MADEASAILFIIGLRRAGIENWVKYALLRVRTSLCLYGYAYALVKTSLYQQEGILSAHASIWSVKVPQRHFL